MFIAPSVLILFPCIFRYFSEKFSFNYSDIAYPPDVSIELPIRFKLSMPVQCCNKLASAPAPESVISL